MLHHSGQHGGGDLGLDATRVGAAVEAEVALLPPLGAPAVLDRPVVFAAVGAETDEQYRVVELGLLATTTEEARRVELRGSTRTVSDVGTVGWQVERSGEWRRAK